MANGKKPDNSKYVGKERWVPGGSYRYLLPESNAGRFLEVKAASGKFLGSRMETTASKTPAPEKDPAAIPRRPGRMKGRFVVTPEFFEPLTDAELREFYGE